MNFPLTTIDLGDLASTLETDRVLPARQRNWSRVATCVSNNNRRLFVKQFIRADSTTLEAGYAAEKSSAALAGSIFEDLDTVHVMMPIAESDLSSVLVYDHVDMEPIDSLVRRHRGYHEFEWAGFFSLLRRIVRELDAEKHSELSGTALINSGTASSPSGIIGFKGLEVRNMATRGGGEIVLFDLGPAKIESVANGTARLVVSIGLLNWGRPVYRFCSGPSMRLVFEACDKLGDLTTLEACLKEVDRQYRGRLKNIDTSRSTYAGLEYLVLRSLGNLYVRQLKRILRKGLQ